MITVSFFQLCTFHWWKNLRIVSKQVPFTPDQATVEAISGWIDAETDRGVEPSTIKNRCSLLQGLIKTASRQASSGS